MNSVEDQELSAAADTSRLLDLVLEAGADIAQALQDIVDDETNAGRSDLQQLIDAWEAAYKRTLP